MRAFLSLLLVLGMSLALSSSHAGDKKEVTLKGKICCLKCELGKADSCQTVIVTKKNDKEEIVLFDKASDKKHHASICSDAKNGSVTGVVTEKDKKKTIAVKSLKFD